MSENKKLPRGEARRKLITRIVAIIVLAGLALGGLASALVAVIANL
ncbi:MAG: hypothetical protein J6S59_05625 [Clostridia bacterium]|nr:hypothetical protein [Clostridia bacterium]